LPPLGTGGQQKEVEMNEKRTTLRELVAKEQVFAPCIWDCFSAGAAEVAGYKAILLSGGALAHSMIGAPDIGLLSADELVWATERIASYSPLPLIVDADEGYGESPLNSYRTVSRLARAGAMAVTIQDTTGVRGYERWGQRFRSDITSGKQEKIEHSVVSTETWLGKIKASVLAMEGTDCMLIARTDSKLEFGLDEAIERCAKAAALGAEMTLIIGLRSLEESREVAAALPGWKMYPDVGSARGVPDVQLDDVAALGFNLVTMHYLEKASTYGMWDFSRHVIADRNTVYADSHDFGGLSLEEQRGVMQSDRKWLAIERECRKV
jgi:methylisocitrate lyase